MEESLTLLLATDEILAIEDYLDKADITTTLNLTHIGWGNLSCVYAGDQTVL